MGLDIVELMIRTEEVFTITIHDEDAGKIITVGDLYRYILGKFNLPYIPSKQIENEGTPVSRWPLPKRKLFHKTIEYPVTPDPAKSPWTTSEVWQTLKAVIQDQLQIDPNEIREEASFNKDLGAD